jgi:hypothetical protein
MADYDEEKLDTDIQHSLGNLKTVEKKLGGKMEMKTLGAYGEHL